MGSFSVPPLISCEDLLQEMSSGANDLVILDVSWDKFGKIDYAAKFEERHIPGAFHFNFKRGTFSSDLYPNDIPNAASFEAYAQQFGINKETKVVVYEAMPLSDRLVVAGRAWWLFRYFGHDNVQVLDGGLVRWTHLKYPLTQGITPLPEAGNFSAEERKEMRVLYEDVVEHVKQQKSEPKIIDSRLASVYEKGAIQGSLNIPLNSFGDEATMCLLGKDAVLAKMKELGFDPVDQPVVVSCHSGMTACGLACIAASAGLWNWRVYLGSYTEWSKRQEQNNEAK